MMVILIICLKTDNVNIVVQATTTNHSTQDQITGGAGGCSISQLGLGSLTSLYIPKGLLPLPFFQGTSKKNFLAEAYLLIIFIFDYYLLAELKCLSTPLKVAGKEINLSRILVHHIWAEN